MPQLNHIYLTIVLFDCDLLLLLCTVCLQGSWHLCWWGKADCFSCWRGAESGQADLRQTTQDQVCDWTESSWILNWCVERVGLVLHWCFCWCSDFAMLMGCRFNGEVGDVVVGRITEVSHGQNISLLVVTWKYGIETVQSPPPPSYVLFWYV